MLEKLKKINKLRDEGKISKEEAGKRKYELAMKDEKKHKKEVEFDNKCTT